MKKYLLKKKQLKIYLIYKTLKEIIFCKFVKSINNYFYIETLIKTNKKKIRNFFLYIYKKKINITSRIKKNRKIFITKFI
ncbi:hypothetical protein [Candidatus Vidania fulgoroideorum]